MNTCTDEQSSLLDDADQQVAVLEPARTYLVRSILGMLTACTDPDSICDPTIIQISADQQRLLSALISELEDLDDRLHNARALL
ncbi:hypothetical protein [Arthrobacter sp. AET 35A]|uniref:hypothetical protein n=1 Tax=Arthrobacter sp. AET 35A TaxID=2292643 RepID=UPI001780F65A|nr:hypothetical protein [Arthrobacter sp. AET 35A]MBE0011107.1 hypothetical protein [Arthrobacter sp. AET 35A]